MTSITQNAHGKLPTPRQERTTSVTRATFYFIFESREQTRAILFYYIFASEVQYHTYLLTMCSNLRTTVITWLHSTII